MDGRRRERLEITELRDHNHKLIELIKGELRTMSAQFDNLTTAVTNAVATIQKLVASNGTNPEDTPDKLQALADELTAAVATANPPAPTPTP